MTYNHIHFVGIKGVGMTPLALIAKEAGYEVTGSDIADRFITDDILQQVGITPLVGFDASHINFPDLVITTGAHGGFDNIEVKAAKDKGIRVVSQGEAVGLFMNGALFNHEFRGISVAGTHGKTTTTAMIATILKEAGKDPSFVIGTGNVTSLGTPGHFGKGEYFVAEADEYATALPVDRTPKFLWQHPQIAVITNIEHDHPDLYPSLDDVRAAFISFTQQLPENGTLITCGDDEQVQLLLKEFSGNRQTYGFNDSNMFRLSNIIEGNTEIIFTLTSDTQSLGEIHLQVAGRHNCLNATAATLVCLSLGLSLEQIKHGLSQFSGTQRRLEKVGQLVSGALLYDDYAHHPTEIRKTLEALRGRYPDKKLVCIFQPHTYSRTKSLFNEFTTAFSAVDYVIIADIYASLRETPDPSVSSEQLVRAMHHPQVKHIRTLDEIAAYVTAHSYWEEYVVVTMGAGDIYKLKNKLGIR